MGIASTQSQLTVYNLIIDGTLECLSVYEHGKVGVSERKMKKQSFFTQYLDYLIVRMLQ